MYTVAVALTCTYPRHRGTPQRALPLHRNARKLALARRIEKAELRGFSGLGEENELRFGFGTDRTWAAWPNSGNFIAQSHCSAARFGLGMKETFLSRNAQNDASFLPQSMNRTAGRAF